jgi:hypothetical protein
VSRRRFDLRAYEDAAFPVLATAIHTPMWARLSTHWVSGELATITIYVQPRGARGRFAPRTNVGRVRVPPRRDTASRPGELIPRANVARRPTDWVRIVAGDGFDLRAYEGVTPAHPDAT